MTAYLRRNGFPDIAACTVDRCIRILGVKGVRRGKKVRTTIPAKDGRRAGDLLDRDFTAAAPNRVWVADFSYVQTWLGFVYVLIIEHGSRRGIAFSHGRGAGNCGGAPQGADLSSLPGCRA
jgi:putative transposase